MSRPSPKTFDYLEPILRELRQFADLTEKSRGVFYIRSKAFLHFHGHPNDAVADVKTSGDWERFPLNSKTDFANLLKLVRQHLASNESERLKKKRASA